MTLNSLFAKLLAWLIGWVLFVPYEILRLVGHLLPPCSSFGIAILTNNAINDAQQFIRFGWPLLSFIPWDVVWGLMSAELLLIFVLWAFKFFPFVIGFIMKYWIFILLVFLLLPIINIIADLNGFNNSPAFTDVLPGTSVTSSISSDGQSGGGFGGGGGGSW